MFVFSISDQQVNLLFKDQMFMQGLSVVACLDDGMEYRCQADGTEGGFFYEDSLSIKLSLKTSGQHLVVSVLAEISKGISWPGRTWHPLNAIRLQIDNLGSITGLCAHYLYNSWWTRPHFGTDLSLLPSSSQSVLWEARGQYCHLITFCDEQLTSFVKGKAEGGVELVVSPQKSGVRYFGGTIMIAGVGDDPYGLMNESVVVGRNQLSFHCKQRVDRIVPEVFDYLGWCSWDACYLDVSEEAVLAKAREFSDKNIPVKWMLIDDGWSEEKDRRLSSFKENREKFPSGIKGLKEKLETVYEVRWLGVWQALTGQWEGLDAGAGLPHQVSIDSQRALPPVDFNDAFDFWNQWHQYLARQGVDFVKVDVQSNLANHYRYCEFPGEVSISVHQALEVSVQRHFDGRLINCMGMSVSQLWNRPSSAVSRNSDDFFPKNDNNIRELALQNSYNALFHDGFYQGDWDMWWSMHQDAEAHGHLRAVSGGPVYTSDPVNKTDAEMLMKLVFNDGRIGRCDGQGKVARDGLFENPQTSGRLLKIWNYLGDVGVLGVFNIDGQSRTLVERISNNFLEGSEGRDWIVYRPATKSCFSDGEVPELSLASNKSELVFFYPESELCCFGLVDKWLPASALIQQIRFSDEGCLRLLVTLRQGGRVVIFSRSKMIGLKVNGQSYCWQQLTEELYEVDCAEWREEVHLECLVSD